MELWNAVTTNRFGRVNYIMIYDLKFILYLTSHSLFSRRLVCFGRSAADNFKVQEPFTHLFDICNILTRYIVNGAVKRAITIPEGAPSRNGIPNNAKF